MATTSKRPRDANTDDEQSFRELSLLIAKSNVSCAIFDCDMTLVDGNIENFASAQVVADGVATNVSNGRTLHLFKDVPSIVSLLRAANVPLAIASASPARDTAIRLLGQLGVKTATQEIHPGSKHVHLKAIAKTLSVPLDRALFFDDLAFNIKTAESCGIGAAVLVRSKGLSLADLKTALRKLRDKGRGAAMMRAWMTSASSSGGRKVAAATSSTLEAEPAVEPPPKRRASEDDR